MLLLHGCDADQRERTWWFTVGGGLDAGETALDAAVRTALHLDEPLPVRYAYWAGGVLRGDLGESIRLQKPVSELIVDRMWPRGIRKNEVHVDGWLSAILGSVIISVVSGAVAGLLGGERR